MLAMASLLISACAGAAGTPVVVSVSINEGDAVLTLGESVTLTAVVVVRGDATEEVVWESGDTGVASVTSAGLVTATGGGNTLVTARSVFDPSSTASVAIAVTEPELASSDWDTALWNASTWR